MYKADVRFNKVLTYMLWCMGITCGLNFLMAYHEPHLIKDATFEIAKIDVFDHDKRMNEDIVSFRFNFKADITGLFNWNTNIIFASIYCEYTSKSSELNKVVVWD